MDGEARHGDQGQRDGSFSEDLTTSDLKGLQDAAVLGNKDNTVGVSPSGSPFASKILTNPSPVTARVGGVFSNSAAFYDAIYSFKHYRREAEILHGIASTTVPGARTLLDVACGTGLHLEHLRDNYEVSGLDLDPEMVELARTRNPGIEVHLADMVDFDLGRRFDLVTCLFSAIGYARTRDRLRQSVRAMARHLAPSGGLIIEPWITPESFVDGFADSMVVEYDGGKIVRGSFSRLEGDVSVLELHYLVRPDGGDVTHFTERHALGLFSHSDYVAAIEEAGLEHVLFDPDGLMGRGLHVATRPS